MAAAATYKFRETGPRSLMYCPYCNKHDRDEMTDEHVIPKSIGGGTDTLIRVCKTCNSTIGSKADALLARHSGMRMTAMMSGKASRGPNRQERHRSFGTLKDGTRLRGYVHVEWEDERTFRLVFQPSGIQDDGQKWMTEVQLAGNTGPPDVRVLDPDELNSTSYAWTIGKDEGMESGMLKILLGIRFMAEGAKLVRLPSYDLIRQSLGGPIDPRVCIEWIDPKKNPDLLPLACENNQHLIWEACPDGDQFHAGLCLFGRVCMTVSISDFGAAVAPADCLIPLPWLRL